MQIQRIDNTEFKSRHQTIRFADDIARRVNICYPRLSPSLIGDFENAKYFCEYREDICEKLEDTVREEIQDAYFETDNLIGKLLAFIKQVKNIVWVIAENLPSLLL